MKRTISFFIIATALNACVAQAAQKSDFGVGRLSEKGREAYGKLRAADVFRVGNVGYAGETSAEELALYDLLKEEEAVEALKGLVSDGSYEGGLYGLLGLSVTNVGEFNRAVEVYKSRERPPERRVQSFAGVIVPEGYVVIQSGCIVSADGWRNVVTRIQSGHYDRLLRHKVKS
jgi:hypothetical protein